MFESELAKENVKGKVVRNSKTDEINLLKRELDNKKNQGKTFGGGKQVIGAPQSDDWCQ